MVPTNISSNLFLMYAVFATLVGASFGSFAGLIIYRVPKGLSVIWPSSFCTSCDRRLKLWHNIPIFSWLLLRGRCALCKTPIGFRTFFFEILLAIAFLALFLQFGFSIAFLERALLLFLLLCLSYVDLDTFSLPLSLLIALFALGVCTSLFYYFMPTHYVAPSSQNQFLSMMVFHAQHSFSLLDRILGGLFGCLGFATINIISTMILRRVRRLEKNQWAMGFGDAVLLGVIGLFVGASHLVVVIFIASALGSIVGLASRFEKTEQSDEEIAEGALPYGPFLAIAAIYVYLL